MSANATAKTSPIESIRLAIKAAIAAMIDINKNPWNSLTNSWKFADAFWLRVKAWSWSNHQAKTNLKILKFLKLTNTFTPSQTCNICNIRIHVLGRILLVHVTWNRLSSNYSRLFRMQKRQRTSKVPSIAICKKFLLKPPVSMDPSIFLLIFLWPCGPGVLVLASLIEVI